MYVIYNEFKSAIQQRVVVERLLPIDWVVEISSVKDLDQANGGDPRRLSV